MWKMGQPQLHVNVRALTRTPDSLAILDTEMMQAYSMCGCIRECPFPKTESSKQVWLVHDLLYILKKVP